MTCGCLTPGRFGRLELASGDVGIDVNDLPEASSVGYYSERIRPHVTNAVCSTPSLRPLRNRACAGLTGSIVEIGFGSGLNVGRYPDEVTSVAAVEPSDVSWKLARDRVQAAKIPITRSGLDGQSLPFDDHSFDSALCTFVLCSIPDVPAALAEIRRVLKPNGKLHFLEHGLAPDKKVQRWQYLLDPIEKRVAGGCHFTRPTVSMLTDNGFAIDKVDSFYDKAGPRFAAYISLGAAVAA